MSAKEDQFSWPILSLWLLFSVILLLFAFLLLLLFLFILFFLVLELFDCSFDFFITHTGLFHGFSNSIFVSKVRILLNSLARRLLARFYRLGLVRCGPHFHESSIMVHMVHMMLMMNDFPSLCGCCWGYHGRCDRRSHVLLSDNLSWWLRSSSETIVHLLSAKSLNSFDSAFASTCTYIHVVFCQCRIAPVINRFFIARDYSSCRLSIRIDLIDTSNVSTILLAGQSDDCRHLDSKISDQVIII